MTLITLRHAMMFYYAMLIFSPLLILCCFAAKDADVTSVAIAAATIISRLFERRLR